MASPEQLDSDDYKLRHWHAEDRSLPLLAPTPAEHRTSALRVRLSSQTSPIVISLRTTPQFRRGGMHLPPSP